LFFPPAIGESRTYFCKAGSSPFCCCFISSRRGITTSALANADSILVSVPVLRSLRCIIELAKLYGRTVDVAHKTTLTPIVVMPHAPEHVTPLCRTPRCSPFLDHTACLDCGWCRNQGEPVKDEHAIRLQHLLYYKSKALSVVCTCPGHCVQKIKRIGQ